MLFTVIMIRKITYSLTGVLLLVLLLGCSTRNNEDIDARVKISLREVGNQLLLKNHDSTSLVLPIKKLAPLRYLLSFQNKLSVHPDSLVSIIQNNFEKSKLPKYYRIEAEQCEDDEVAYSYQMSVDEERTIIPCSGRELPINCYHINVQFVKDSESTFPRAFFIYIFGLITLVFVLFRIYKNKKGDKKKSNENYIEVGRYKFYEAQNKLIKEAEEITLSKKECELLAIFISRPNEVVTRDELTKRVWEDNGVIVGRSLDTFISKLRKKLKDDDSIKLTNVHGVGYKLEVF